MKRFSPAYMLIAVLAMAFLTSCNRNNITPERPQEGTSEYFQAIKDSLCGVYLDTLELKSNLYFSEFRFLPDGKALSIIYNDNKLNGDLDVDSTNLTWELGEKLIADRDGKKYYAMGRTTTLAELGLSQALIDTLLAEGFSNEYTDSLLVSVDANGHTELYEVGSDYSTTSKSTFSSFKYPATKWDWSGVWDEIKHIYHTVEDEAEQMITAAKAVLSTMSLSEKVIATGNDYSDWMANIDNFAPVSLVSMPGTHDTFTYNVHGFTLSYASTQRITMEQQFDMGVRCFDIRLDYAERLRYDTHYHGQNMNGKEDLILTHNGLVTCYITFPEALDRIYAQLQKHTGETVVLMVKIDNGNISGDLLDKCNRMIDEEFQKRLDEGQLAPWHPNMLMGSSRGKMIVVARYPTEKEFIAKVCVKGKESSQDWGDNNHDQQLTASGKEYAELWVQDYYHQHDNESEDGYVYNKEDLVKKNLDYINSIDYDLSFHKIWTFNQTSGYCGSNNFVMNYPRVAGMMNPFLVYELQHDYAGKYTGIIVMDYAGLNMEVHANVSPVVYETHGDELPGVVIKNNNLLKFTYQGQVRNMAKTTIK